MDILQALYDSEINFELSTFWDEGFSWELGDPLNGVLEKGTAETLAKAIGELAEAAVQHFPSSQFAQWIRANC